MTSIADSSVTIQTSSRSIPSTPPWFGEVALLVYHLRTQGVLFGYALSGERTLEAFYRGAFEPTLSDEYQEQDPDRWCSQAAWGQECWQIVSQWVWNLRLELGHHLSPEPARTTEFAPALPPTQRATIIGAAPKQGYAPAVPGQSWKQGRFSGRDFLRQPDGTLRCPAGQTLASTEQRREADGSLRVVYEARIRECRPCRLREHCQWHGQAAKYPRRVSVLLPASSFQARGAHSCCMCRLTHGW